MNSENEILSTSIAQQEKLAAQNIDTSYKGSNFIKPTNTAHKKQTIYAICDIIKGKSKEPSNPESVSQSTSYFFHSSENSTTQHKLTTEEKPAETNRINPK